MGERTELIIPKDAEGKKIHRAMSAPLVEYQKMLGSGSVFADIFDLTLSQLAERVFAGFHVSNPSPTRSIHLSLTEAFGSNLCCVVPPQREFALDQQTFGQSIYDEYHGVRLSHVRAKLDALDGTLASGTIIYSGNPTDGQKVIINGITYEFDSTGSVLSTSTPVTIAGSADLTWTNLVNAVNAADQAVTASINTGADTVTITSNYGGTYGNSTTISDGVPGTGATFSGATLAGGAGGVLPVFHIW
jgi:hypothetical protein